MEKPYLPFPIFDNLDSIGAMRQNTQLAADERMTAEFLYSYRGSEATFNAYRRELERFLLWSKTVINKKLKQLRRPDIESFIEFCQRPPLTWIGTKNVPRFLIKEGERIPNPEWKPYVVNVSKVVHKEGQKPLIKNYLLSTKALESTFSILSSFFNYLLQENFLEMNPVAQIRQKSKFIRKNQHKAKIRKLSELQWSYVIETAEGMAKAEPAAHERTLFMMNALYGMYLRISELSARPQWQPKMGDFEQDAEGNWWFTTVGKGNKERQISVSDAMIAALKRYRQSLGLSPLPARGEITPLLSKSQGKGSITSTRHIRWIVQSCFDNAIERMLTDGFKEEAEQLKAATVHWLRHTGISEDVKRRPREHVRDDAGHTSSITTDRYIDVELQARARSAKHKKIKPD